MKAIAFLGLFVCGLVAGQNAPNTNQVVTTSDLGSVAARNSTNTNRNQISNASPVTVAVPQNLPNASPAPLIPEAAPIPPTPVIITPGQSDAALEQLSPPQRFGRRGGVFVTGAGAVSGTNAPTPLIVTPPSDVLAPDAVGAAGTAGGVVAGAGANLGMPTLSPSNDFIFVPTLNQPGIPGAIGGRGANPNAPNGTTTSPTTPNSGTLTGPAGTVGPALPPAGTTTIVPPPSGPGADLPGSRIIPPPRPNASAPAPISGSR